MAFVDCLAVALEGKEITKAQHDQLRNRYERLIKKHSIESGSLAAERAKKSLLDELRGETREKKRRAKLAINAVKRLDAEAKAFRNASGKADIGTAFLYKLEHFGTAGFDSVASRELQIIGFAQTRLSTMMQHFRRTYLKGDLERLNKTRLPLLPFRPLLLLLPRLVPVANNRRISKTSASSWRPRFCVRPIRVLPRSGVTRPTSPASAAWVLNSAWTPVRSAVSWSLNSSFPPFAKSLCSRL